MNTNYKISFLRSSLHDNKSLDEQNKKFILDIEKELGEKLVPASLDDYDCTLKLIFIESGGSEGLFLRNFASLKEPYYLLTSGSNNSLAASLEILTYLNLHELNGEVLHGDMKYIARRIQELKNVQKVQKDLSHFNFGVIGQPSDWLISSLPEEEALKKKFNISLKNIPIKELIEEFNKVDIKSYHLEIPLAFEEKELDQAKKMYLAIANLKERYHLNALTIRCFDLLTTCHTTSCLGFALLNEQGIIATCEGDLMAMVTMSIIKSLFNQSSFQANPSRIDVTSKEILFAHCTIPFDMLTSYKLDTHFESGIGVAVRGKLKEDEVTILRLSSDLKHYFVCEGRIIKNLEEDNLCRTQIVIKCDDDISSLLTHPCGNHHIIFYGHHQEEINSLLKAYNLQRVL